MLIDTHAHLDEASFETDLSDVLERAAESGLEAILSIGISAPTSQAAVRLAESHSQLYAVVGIQPNYVTQAQQGDFERIEQLAEHPRVVGIGETGLDRYWDFAPIGVQQEFFRKHIALARQVSKPFIVHCRDAEPDVVDLLQSERQDGLHIGVMHSFCGDQQTLDACLAMGMHISFAGMLTYKRNEELRCGCRAGSARAIADRDRFPVSGTGSQTRETK